MSNYKVSVDILDYIEDCHSAVPPSEREWIAEEISRKFDSTQLYDELDSWVESICRTNGITYGEAEP